MKSMDLLDSFENIRNEYIMEAQDMKKHYGAKSPASRVKFMLLAAIIAVSLLLVTAFAAMNYLGMQEITQGTTYEVPSEASPYIETQSAQATTTEDWSCTMLESLFDSASFTISVGISGGDKYVVVPEYCSAGDDVSEIGLPRGQTLGDYAAQQGKTLLYVGAGIQDRDKLGIPTTAQFYKSQSDSEMTIVETGQKSTDVSVTEGTCSVSAWVDGQKDVTRVELPFTVKEAAGDVLVYKAEGANEVAGICTNSFRVYQSPAGNSIVFDQELPEVFPDDLKWMNIDGITYAEGGWLDDGNGGYECRWSKVQGNFGDTLTLRFINWDNEVMGTVQFRLQK
jgi:hypothetical protein